MEMQERGSSFLARSMQYDRLLAS